MSDEKKKAALASLGERLRSARQSCGLTIAESSKLVGLHVGTLQRWETGDLEPKVLKLAALAKSYGVDLEWIISGVSTEGILAGSTIVDRSLESAVIDPDSSVQVHRLVDWCPDRTTAYYRVPENFEIAKAGRETELRIKLFERELDKRLPSDIYAVWERFYDTLAAIKKKGVSKE